MGVDIYISGFYTENTHVVYYVWCDVLGRQSTPELIREFLGELNTYGYLLGLSKQMEQGRFETTQDMRTLVYVDGITTHKWYIEPIQ